MLETPPTPLFRGELFRLGLSLEYRLLTPKRSDNFFNSIKTFFEKSPSAWAGSAWAG